MKIATSLRTMKMLKTNSKSYINLHRHWQPKESTRTKASNSFSSKHKTKKSAKKCLTIRNFYSKAYQVCLKIYLRAGLSLDSCLSAMVKNSITRIAGTFLLRCFSFSDCVSIPFAIQKENSTQEIITKKIPIKLLGGKIKTEAE